MLRVTAIVLALLIALTSFGGHAEAAAEQACLGQLGQYTSGMVQNEVFRPAGATLIRHAAQEPDFGEVQAHVASTCNVNLLRVRYSY